ncbi:hypothetical protein Tco_1492900 [Tanacetum coccineum]
MRSLLFTKNQTKAFNEAWERFKGLLRQCPHHGFSELHQLDTFYNSLNYNTDQGCLRFCSKGGNFLVQNMPQEGLQLFESKSKFRYSRSRASDSRELSINLLPHSIYKKLELEALTPTRMTLELANRSITHPMGIAEDVVVRAIGGFTFLADFVQVPRSDTYSPWSSARVTLTLPATVIESLPMSPILVEDSEPTQEEIDILLVPDDLIPPGVEDADSEDEVNEYGYVKYYKKTVKNGQKRTRERMSDHEAKENQASAFCSQPQLNHRLGSLWIGMAAETPRVFRAKEFSLIG